MPSNALILPMKAAFIYMCTVCLYLYMCCLCLPVSLTFYETCHPLSPMPFIKRRGGNRRERTDKGLKPIDRDFQLVSINVILQHCLNAASNSFLCTLNCKSLKGGFSRTLCLIDSPGCWNDLVCVFIGLGNMLPCFDSKIILNTCYIPSFTVFLAETSSWPIASHVHYIDTDRKRHWKRNLEST